MTLVRRRGGCPGSVDASRSSLSSRSTSRRVTFSSILSAASPRTAVALEKLVGRRRPPRAGGVVGKVGAIALPRGNHRVHDRPLFLHLVRAREERRVSEHAVEDEPLVGLRQADAKRAAVKKVHVYRTNRHSL